MRKTTRPMTWNLERWFLLFDYGDIICTALRKANVVTDALSKNDKEPIRVRAMVVTETDIQLKGTKRKPKSKQIQARNGKDKVKSHRNEENTTLGTKTAKPQVVLLK
ncbi:hypothetical protein Tco_1407172 [Tanacetum coccineum]